MNEGNDYELIRKYLSEKAYRTVFEEIFWIDIPESLHAGDQRDHTQCRPFYFAVNLSLRQVSFELLIRSREIIRCSCIAYATPEQRDYIIHFADKMLDDLDIRL